MAKKLLKWQPRVGLDDGLKKTIEWFREDLDERKVRTTPVL